MSLIEVDRKLYFIKVYSRQSDNLQSSYLCLDPFLLLPERICPPTWLDQSDFAQFFGFWELLNSRLPTAETNKSLLDLQEIFFTETLVHFKFCDITFIAFFHHKSLSERCTFHRLNLILSRKWRFYDGCSGLMFPNKICRNFADAVCPGWNTDCLLNNV